MTAAHRGRPVACGTAMLLMSCAIRATAGELPDASQLLSDLQSKYEAMQSYSARGDVTSTMETSPAAPSNANRGGVKGPQVSHHHFTMKLGRPELYRIEWKQQMPNFTMKGAVWSDGDSRVVTVPGKASPVEPKDTQTALAMATGISGGVANTIPFAFFALQASPFKALTDVMVAGEERIEGDACYVVRGRLANQAVTLWISKETKLLRQRRHDFAGPMSMPELTDDDVKQALESMDREATADTVKAMRAQLEAARSMMSLMTGHAVEIHRDIKVDLPLRVTEFRMRTHSKGQK